MFTFSKALVRSPGQSMVSGLTSHENGLPDYKTALAQHKEYIAALERCGLEVTVLEADENYPDSTFVEDVAVLTRHGAIVTRPAAPSRRDEVTSMRNILPRYYQQIDEITAPGTLDGGDVMQVGNHFFIGQSARTNAEGAKQFIAWVERYGMTGSTIPVTGVLHLKTGVTCLNEKIMVATGNFIQRPEFSDFTIIDVPDHAAQAANCIRINDNIIMPAGFPEVRERLREFFKQIIEVNISEYAKIDGGLTCLSLRF